MNVLIALFAYALIDYCGYSATKDGSLRQPLYYTACLFLLWGLFTWYFGIGFAVLHLTFWADWIYYVYTFLIGSWLKPLWKDAENWEDTRRDFANGIDHAIFTPFGAFDKFILRHDTISPVALAGQSIFGVVIFLLIQHF